MGQNYECDDQMVSHPVHYQSKNGLEVIDVIDKYTNPLLGVYATDTANIIKYACRWKRKNGVQDIKKIIWYATHLLNKVVESDKYDSGRPLVNDGTTLDNALCSFVTDDMDDIETLCTHDIITRACSWYMSSTNDLKDITSIINHANALVRHLEKKESN